MPVTPDLGQGHAVTARRTPAGTMRGEDGLVRCGWAGDDPLYVAYHDREWGRPVRDDTRLFEKLSLEGFQAGLAWITILRKREHFRRAFRGFEIDTVARMNGRHVNTLLRDPGIVRHRGKIEAALHNARRAQELQQEWGSLAAFVWQFEPAPEKRPRRLTRTTLRKLTETEASRALSGELRARGFRFVGPTTAYAFMQSMGIVNDHLEGCHRREPVETARDRFRRPRPRGSASLVRAPNEG